MGRSLRLNSDPEFARSHEAGTPFAPVQPLVHSRYGSVAFVIPRYWVLEWKGAEAANNELTAILDDVAHTPVDRNDMRLLDVEDAGLAVRAYYAGSQLLNHTVRFLQHLCEEIERVTGIPLTGRTLEERLREAAKNSRLEVDTTTPWYNAMIEILHARDALEHPQTGNVSSASDNDWDRVPLAWLLSGRASEAYDRFATGIVELVDRWIERRRELDQPGQLTGVKRGIRSKLQFLKPPPRPSNDRTQRVGPESQQPDWQ